MCVTAYDFLGGSTQHFWWYRHLVFLLSAFLSANFIPNIDLFFSLPLTFFRDGNGPENVHDSWETSVNEDFDSAYVFCRTVPWLRSILKSQFTTHIRGFQFGFDWDVWKAPYGIDSPESLAYRFNSILHTYINPTASWCYNILPR